METVYADIAVSLQQGKHWEVTEASQKGYFYCDCWKQKITNAEKVIGKDKIFFNLFDGGFVMIEK